MRKTLLAALLFSTSFLTAQTPVVQVIPTEQTEVSESDADSEAAQNLPYPIIFIHGLVGNSIKWGNLRQYLINSGLKNGGLIKFNLNCDGDKEETNIYSSQSDICHFSNVLIPADFYTIDFNVSIEGISLTSTNDPNQSNQAAITKQGAAIKFAIEDVLNATGRDKVILMGHSMGGLAARQYLQTPSFWQPDGKHHVAKLITSGTPHLGNNMTALDIGDFFNGADEQSDAVRDLRKSYFFTQEDGVFLSGGLESYSVIKNSPDWNYHSVDVNCNGDIGESTLGLNEKNMPTNLDVACIVGTFNLSGDGIVLGARADIQTKYPALRPARFDVWAWHTSLPDETETNIKSLDEPDDFYLAYGIDLNKDYFGHFTEQGEGSNWGPDYDDYLFFMPQSGNVKMVAWSLPGSNTGMNIVRASDEAYVFQSQSYGASILQKQTWLPSGHYYLDFENEASSTSWNNFPYKFRLESTVTSPTDAPEWALSATLAPNPAADYTTFSADFGAYTEGIVTLSDALGRVVQSQPFEGDALTHTFELASAAPGAYVVTLRTAEGVRAWTLLKQ